jgi:hypothetical protein
MKTMSIAAHSKLAARASRGTLDGARTVTTMTIITTITTTRWREGCG